QRRDVRNRLVASAQVNTGRVVRVSIGGPFQTWSGIHLLIVCSGAVIPQGVCLEAPAHAVSRAGSLPNAGTMSSRRRSRGRWSAGRRPRIRSAPAGGASRGPGSLLRPAASALCHLGLGHGDSERSEEHTSELQSPYDLVCRLLL